MLPPPKKLDPFPQISGAKNIKFWTTFSATYALDTAYLRKEKTSHRQTKMLLSIYSVSVNIDLISVAFDPETADTCLLIVTELSAAITFQSSKKVATSLVFDFKLCFLPVRPYCFWRAGRAIRCVDISFFFKRFLWRPIISEFSRPVFTKFCRIDTSMGEHDQFDLLFAIAEVTFLW